MADGVNLGSANLELGADLAPLRADLEKAKAEVAVAAAEMQKLLDRHVDVSGKKFATLGSMIGSGLQAPLTQSKASLAGWATAQEAALAKVRSSLGDTSAAYMEMANTAEAAADLQVAASGRVVEAYGAQAAAARAAADEEEAAAARSAVARGVLGGAGDRGGGGPASAAGYRLFTAGREGAADVRAGSSGIWGVRGPTPPPGSMANPIVVALEAASRTPLGSLAAAIGESSSASDATQVGNEKGGRGTILAATPPSQQGPAAAQRPVVAVGPEGRPEKPSEDALALAKAALRGAMERSGPEVAVAKAREGGSSPAADAIMADLLSKRLGPGQIAKTAPGYRQGYEALGYTVASRAAGGPARLYAPGGQPGTSNYGLSQEASLLAEQRAAEAREPQALAAALTAALDRPYGAGAMSVPGFGPRSGRDAFGPDITRQSLALGEDAQVARALAPSGGGGGGYPPWLMSLLWGRAGGGGGGGGFGGRFGGLLAAGGAMAGIGSLGSFAGFGPEHLLLTAGGIAGSGVAALGGGALLAGGALGKVGVGMGSDAAVMSSTIADTGQLYKGFEAVTKAVRTYGKGSEQAKEATKELNTIILELGNTAGVKAESGVAHATMALNAFWDQATSGARVQASKIPMQVVDLGKDYIPLVAKAAEENFSATNTGLKPLFAWLEGPEGMGIFTKLENEFREEIPTAMKALDMGFQFLGKTIADVAPLTGGLLADLDKFFTKMDEPQNFAKWEEMMSHMIKDFHVWGAFIKELGGALVDLFDKDAHTGEGIIETLTKMLHGVREWEKSVTGSSELKTIFTVHKEEVIALLKALSELVAPFEEIYMTLSPPLVKAVTTVTEAVAEMLTAFESLGSGATWVVGIGLILTKLKLLVPLLTQAGVATGLLSGEVSGATKMSDLTVAQSQKLGFLPVASKGAAAEGAAVEGGAAEEGLTGALLTDAMASTKSSLSAALPDLIKGGVAALVASMVGSAVGVHGTSNTALSGAVGGGVLGFEFGGPFGAAAGAALGGGLVEALHALNEKAPMYGEQFAKAYYAPFAVILPKTVMNPLEEKLAKIRDERERAEHPSEALGGLTHLEEKIPLYGKLFSGGPSANTSQVQAAERKEGVNAAEAFQQGFRDSTQKSSFGFSLAAFQALYKLAPEARKAAAQTMLAYATELVQRKELPANALGEIIHQLERYFPELTATLAKQGANTSRELTAALNLKQAEANTQAALKNIDVAFGTSALTVGQALKATEYAVAHSTGATKHYWEEKLSALQHATEEEKKAVKASAAAQLESLRNLGLGLKAGVTSWETYANGVTAWSKKLSERVGDGIESLAQGISTINKMLEGELKGLGAPAEVVGALVTGKKGVNLKANPVNPSPAAGEGGPPLAGHAAGGLLQIGRPGDAGRDTVGLNVGGLPIAVAPGEQVAVFNRHQLPIVNAALAPMGGLSGLFSQVSTPNYMAAGGIVAPHVSGAGAIPDIVRGGLSLVAKAADAKVSKASAASARGGPGGRYSGKGGKGSGGSPSANERLGREMMIAAGYPASEWPYLQELWQRESGWSATAMNDPTGVWLAAGNASGIPQSDGHGNVFPYGDARAQIAWGLNYLKANYPSIRAANEKDKGGSYALGGLLHFATGGLLGFASGGLPGVTSSHAQKTTRGLPKKAKGLGKSKKPTGLFKPVPGLKEALPDVYQQQLKELASIMERQVPQLEEEYGDANEEDTQELAKAPHAGEFIITPTATERLAGVTLPWEDKPNVELRLSQLTGLEGYWTGIHEHLNSALEMTNPVTAGTVKAIQERKKKIEEIRAKIAELRKKLAAKLKAIRDRITANIKEITVHEHALTALGNPTKANNAARSHLKAEINKLKGENKNLGGDETEVGTGGEIGSRTKKAETEITTLQTNSAALVSQQKELEERHTMLRGDVTTIAGQSGHGGSLEQALLKHGEIAQQIVELGGTPTKLKEAILEAGGGAESPLELAEREKAQLEEKLKLKTEELKVSNTALSVFGGSGDIGSGGKNAFLAAMSGGGLVPLPYAGSFDVGGVVDAPEGAARVAVVHGQEEILTPEQRRGGTSVVIHQKNEMMHPSDPDVLMGVGKATVRGMRLQGYRQSKRINPGI